MIKRVLGTLVFFAVVCASAFGMSFFDETMLPASRIILRGDETVTVEVFSEYKDEGCIAERGTPIYGYTPLEYSASGEVDTAKIGTYTINYTLVEDSNVYASRTVSVVDTVPPVITAPEEITVYVGTSVFDFEYSALDNYDGDLTAAVVKTENAQSVTLSVTDSSGNTATHTVSVNFIEDTTPPVLTLAGVPAMCVKLGGTYTEAGYTAVDNLDGDITSSVTISGSVDTSAVGKYEITYSVSDKKGNTAQKKRIVSVYESTATEPLGSVIYLTFDDGPGKYTEQLLSILSQYGVKATFFVTNQFPEYQNLIGRAYSEGHAIGVHTYSHRWSVYDSTAAYFEDFCAMNDIIKYQTGQYSKIFRFPGGTSNTVSQKHCAGIMTRLVEEMKNAGYVGFDWNLGSLDTENNTTPAKVALQVKRNLKSGTANIVLMHDIKAHTVNAIPEIIRYGIENGYTFATLNENVTPFSFSPAN